MTNLKSTMDPSIFRRTVLKSGVVGLAGLALVDLAPASQTVDPEADTARPAKLAGLLHNEDCTDFFGYQDCTAGKAVEAVDGYVDVLAAAGVSVLMLNTNARRTNYRSNVWEAFWDGYDPDGSDEQPFLLAVPPDRRKDYRGLVGNMRAAHLGGVDYPAQVIQRCRHHGIAPWISLRMNDVHENDKLDHPFHSPLWRKTELFRQGHPGYYARALDYAHAEVRDHYRALIIETLERFDIDGLELDFMREPYLFSVGQEQQGRQVLTEWLRGIRSLVDDAAKRRGHAVMIGVRVPSDPHTALGLGLDAPVWAKEGLVDLVVVTPRWATLEFAMPLEKWRRLLGDRVTLAGGLEVIYRTGSPDIPVRHVSREEATGAAVAVLSGGADVVYLFNYFQLRNGIRWLIPQYQSMLQSFSSLKALTKQPRRHAVTFRDVVVPGENYRPPLPARGTQISFALPLGPIPSADWQAEVAIEIATVPTEAGTPAVSINGVAAELHGNEMQTNGNRLLTYLFPPAAVSGKDHDTIAVTTGESPPVTLHRVEVGFRP